MKQCRKCKQDYEATSEFFHKDRRRSDGLKGECKTCVNGYSRERYASSEVVRERASAQSRAYFAAHRELRLDQMRDWYEANQDYYLRQHKASQANARAANLGVPGTLTVGDIYALEGSQKGKCDDCGKRFTHEGDSRMTLDHIMPMGLGGANEVSNAHLLCERCHRRKNKVDCRLITEARHAGTTKASHTASHR